MWLKFGGGYQHQKINVLQGIATNGFFVFAPFPVTDAFASFLTGQAVVFLQGIGDFSRAESPATIRTGMRRIRIRSRRDSRLMPVCVMSCPNHTPKSTTGYRCLSPEKVPGSTGMPRPGSSIRAIRACPAGLIPTDSEGICITRIGTAWDPNGKGKFLVSRRRSGIFYEPYYTGQGGPLASADQCAPLPGNTAGGACRNFGDPFNGNPLAPGTFSTPLTNLTLSPTLTLPYTQDWDLNLQRFVRARFAVRDRIRRHQRALACPALSKRTPAVFVPGIKMANRFRIPATPINVASIPAVRLPIRRVLVSFHRLAKSRVSPIPRTTRCWRVAA